MKYTKLTALVAAIFLLGACTTGFAWGSGGDGGDGGEGGGTVGVGNGGGQGGASVGIGPAGANPVTPGAHVTGQAHLVHILLKILWT